MPYSMITKSVFQLVHTLKGYRGTPGTFISLCIFGYNYNLSFIV